MKNLTNQELLQISGGQIDEQTFFSPCSFSVINFLKSRNNFFKGLLSEDKTMADAGSAQMQHYQSMVTTQCTLSDLRENEIHADAFVFLMVGR